MIWRIEEIYQRYRLRGKADLLYLRFPTKQAPGFFRRIRVCARIVSFNMKGPRIASMSQSGGYQRNRIEIDADGIVKLLQMECDLQLVVCTELDCALTIELLRRKEASKVSGITARTSAGVGRSCR